MTRQLIIGLIGEGKTDYRFLNSIIRRTYEELAFDCVGDVEILSVQNIKIDSDTFPEYVFNAAKKAYQELGVMILCVHTDADAKSDNDIFDQKINPAIDKVLNEGGEEVCRIIVPIVPITMTESWMLADEDLLKDEIGTNQSLAVLGITNKPEHISNPKEKLKEVIRAAFAKHKGRRKQLNIAELYLPIGQKAKLEKLRALTSFKKFEESAREALIKMNYLIID
ncbi:MAG: DUF4276 family protein [Bacteroidota bacterium]